MKCPNCGKKVTGRICKFCSSELPFNEMTVSIRLIIIDALYIIDRIFYPPAKVMFVFWSICWSFTFLSNGVSLSPYIGVIIFGYIFMCGMANLFYLINRKKCIKYKLKIIEKKQVRLQKTHNTYYPYKGLLDEAHHLADIANTTTDNDTFFNTYDRLIEIMTELKKYEHLGIFTNSPTEDLNNLIYGKEAATNRFYERQNAEKYSNSVNTNDYQEFDNMDGHDFEYFCADLLRDNGFSDVEVTQGSGDHGIDILARKDDITYAIQCKCYSSNVGNAAVQQASTGRQLYHKDIAVVLTNQYFTQQAKDEANAIGVKLWDRNKLRQLIEHSNAKKGQ